MDFRINQKEEQRLRVLKAQNAVRKAEEDIRKNNQEIEDTKIGMRTADPKMYEFYDKYLEHLWDEAERLENIRIELQKQLDEEIEKLVKCEQAVKVLEKHKEKNKEAYLQEEKAQELKQYSEIGVTRHYRHKQEVYEEELKQIIKESIEAMEGNNL